MRFFHGRYNLLTQGMAQMDEGKQHQEYFGPLRCLIFITVGAMVNE
jgi:hypothetical protein